MLTAEKQEFLSSRKTKNSRWSRVGTTLGVLWFIFGVIFLREMPESLNPFNLYHLLQSEIDGIALSEAIGPMITAIFILIWAFVFVLIFNNATWLATETKLLAIIHELQAPQSDGRSPLFVAGLWLLLILIMVAIAREPSTYEALHSVREWVRS